MVNTQNLPKTLATKGVVFVISCFTMSSILLLSSCNIEAVNLPLRCSSQASLLLCPRVHCSITIDWSLVRSKLSVKLILSESPSSLKKIPLHQLLISDSLYWSI